MTVSLTTPARQGAAPGAQRDRLPRGSLGRWCVKSIALDPGGVTVCNSLASLSCLCMPCLWL